LSPDKASSEKIHIKVKKIVVSGGLPERSVKTMIERAMPAINMCYRAASGNHSIPKGEAVFTLVVGPDGRVIKASMEKCQGKYNNFERCMVKILKALQFPANAGRKDVIVTITFIL
jgi:hypothetical protein